jgi:hypothetical protein
LNLENSLSFKIFNHTDQLPKNWNDLAIENTFLSTNYLQILEQSAPINMICHFIGIFQQEELVGIAISQFIDANQLASFGNREKCLKTYFRDFVLKNFASHVLFVGNNMLTGQNAFVFSHKIKAIEGISALKNACDALKTIYKNQRKKIHLTIFKDFSETEIVDFTKTDFKDFLQFSIQPNMVFGIKYDWKTEQNYVDALTKRYRDQYKRARKKAIDIEKRKLNYEEILNNEGLIYDLYFHVAKNAPFNTFFLSKNHFLNFKFILKDHFLFYGYFLNQKMIGFNTLIKNGNAMDTYFLGYDESIQKDKMLYLNMLYDMIACSINLGFKEIVFARTALEIKSSVGAKPQKMFGFIEHSNPLINRFMPKIFPFLEPNVVWQERNPFK